MAHPLICVTCGDYRYVEFQGIRLEKVDEKKGVGVELPVFYCKTCDQVETILPKNQLLKFRDQILPSLSDGEYIDIPLKNIFSRLDPDKRFKRFDHLEFQYDSRDYYIIPGIYREEDDGYLTPVFFDKDLLLYYNNHPDYSVKLTSFSTGNIYYKGERMFEWGFGINRYGKIFKWLGDLDKDFADEHMKPHLKRFQASNLPSDHEIVSKFYLTQNPFSPSDAFQDSDNETQLFSLLNKLNSQIKKSYGLELVKVNIESFAEYYKPPILEERNQIFSAYLSLNKYFVENLQEETMKSLLLKSGINKTEFEKDGRKLGTLKLFQIFIEKFLKKPDAKKIIGPLFVLNDLRQLHGHISDTSFNERYNNCKERLGLTTGATDLEVFTTLITQLIALYRGLIQKPVEEE